MGAMSKASAALHAEVRNAIMAEVEQIGADGINAAGIVARFVGRGVSERQLYRWINQIMSSGQPGQHIARKIKQAAAERSARVPDPAEAAAEVAAEARELLPARVSPDDIVAACTPAEAARPKIRVIEMLAGVIEDAATVHTPPSPFQIGAFGGRGVGCEANKGSCVAGRSSVYGLYATLKHPGSDRSRTSPAFGTVSAGA